MPQEDRTALLDKLTVYTRDELLGGKSDDLDAQTPLLEWGVLNSLETARLLAYIRDEFDVRIPPAKVTATHFRNLDSITDLVSELQAVPS